MVGGGARWRWSWRRRWRRTRRSWRWWTRRTAAAARRSRRPRWRSRRTGRRRRAAAAGGGGRGGRGGRRDVAAAAAVDGGEREGSELVENVIAINRVAKVVKGGRRFSLQRARRRWRWAGDASASRPARRTKCRRRCARPSTQRAATWSSIPLTGGTIPHEIVGKHGAGSVLMKPAAPGAGVIAGGAVRAIMECAGIRDILTKSLGSTNPHNMVRAALDGLQQLTTVEQIARERGIEVSSLAIGRAPSRRRPCTCQNIRVASADTGPRPRPKEHAHEGQGSHQAGAKRHRPLVADASTLEAIGLRHHQDVVVKQDSPSLRGQIKHVRHLVEGDAGRGVDEWQTKHEGRAWRGRAKLGLHNLGSAPGFAPESQATRPRTGLGHGQDVRQGTQGYQGARGPSRSGRRQAAVRGRADAAHAPAAEAWIHESVPRRESGRASRRPRRCSREPK